MDENERLAKLCPSQCDLSDNSEVSIKIDAKNEKIKKQVKARRLAGAVHSRSRQAVKPVGLKVNAEISETSRLKRPINSSGDKLGRDYGSLKVPNDEIAIISQFNSASSAPDQPNAALKQPPLIGPTNSAKLINLSANVLPANLSIINQPKVASSKLEVRQRPPLKRPPLFLKKPTNARADDLTVNTTITHHVKVAAPKLEVLRADKLQIHSLNGRTESAAPPMEIEMVSLKSDPIKPVSVEVKETVVTIEPEEESKQVPKIDLKIEPVKKSKVEPVEDSKKESVEDSQTTSKPTENVISRVPAIVKRPSESVIVIMPEMEPEADEELARKPTDKNVLNLRIFKEGKRRYKATRKEKIEAVLEGSSGNKQEIDKLDLHDLDLLPEILLLESLYKQIKEHRL